MKCGVCGLEVDMPFRCNYCKNFYCPEHRLPENHNCVESWRVKAVRSVRATTSPMALATPSKSVLLPPQRSKVRFSSREIRHLIVGTSLVTLAGISAFVGNLLGIGLFGLIVSSLLFSLGFILHELAHKYVAQGYGLWAEFRLSRVGLLLTALSVVSPIKFIAPGAVMIGGYTDNERMGRTALAGPIVNIVIAGGLLTLLPALASGALYKAVLAGASINAFLALFNLIPFAVFDGQKIFAWNKKYWVIVMIASLALTIYTNVVLRPFG